MKIGKNNGSKYGKYMRRWEPEEWQNEYIGFAGKTVEIRWNASNKTIQLQNGEQTSKRMNLVVGKVDEFDWGRCQLVFRRVYEFRGSSKLLRTTGRLRVHTWMKPRILSDAEELVYAV